MRIAFALQIRWRVRAALTSGDVGYVFDLVKFSSRAFGPSATMAVLGSRLKLGTDEGRDDLYGPRHASPTYAIRQCRRRCYDARDAGQHSHK
jgi:hypothetical protein